MEASNNITVQEFNIGEKSKIFGIRTSIIAECVKFNTNYVITMKLKNVFYSKTFSVSQLIKTSENKLLLVGDTFYGNEGKIYHEISNENLEKDIEDAIFLLTKDIQEHLVIRDVLHIVERLNHKGLNIRFTSEQNSLNLDYEIFNIDQPCRKVFLYFEGGNIKMEFEDTRMLQTEIEKELSEIEEFEYSNIEKWLKGESMISKIG